MITPGTSIYIVKGGETAQTGHVWHGPGTDSRLTEQGEKSAANLQSRIDGWGITSAYTSPQERMIESAKIALTGSSIVAAVNDDLRPRKILPFERMSGVEIKALYRQFNKMEADSKVTSDGVFSEAWGPWKLGAFEINEHLRARIQNFIETILDFRQGENVFVVTHVDWIREAYRLYAGAPDTEDYAVTAKSVLHLTFDANGKFLAAEREEMPNR